MSDARPELLVLGSGTAIPTADRGSSGYYLRTGRGPSVLLDAGSGTIARLARAGVPVDDVTEVCITHFHPDHTVDLTALIFALTNPRFHETFERLRVHGPDGIERFYESMRGLFGKWVEPRTYTLEIRPAGEGFELPGVRVRTFPMLHTDVSLGYRFEIASGPIVAYSGDTDECDEAVELGRDADLFVLECAFPEGQHRKGHLTPSRAGRIAAAAGCRRLLLTHFYPECEGSDLVGPCREAGFEGEILLATDGLRVPLEESERATDA